MIKKRIGIIIYIILAILSIACLTLVLNFSKIRTNQKKIAYHKTANTSFVTELKDNSYYNTKYLESTYNVVANLIEAFKIDYNYVYTLSEDAKYNLTYSLKAYLEVYDSTNNTKPIEKKEYELVPRTAIEGTGSVIKVDLLNQTIDYQNYNKIVQNWKKEVTPEANLRIVFNVSWIGETDTFDNQINDTYTSTIKIPISSQKTITIEKPANVDESNTMTEKDELPMKYKITFALIIVVFVACLVRIFLYINEINEEKDKYEQQINKILREFDRAITQAKGKFTLKKGDNNIEVNDFYEVMDVHDNLNIPIIFYRNSKRECYFAIRNESTVYYCTLKKSTNLQKNDKIKK